MPAIPARTSPVSLSGSSESIHFYKDPDEVLDFTLDWTARLNGTELIINSEWLRSVSDMTLDVRENNILGALTTIWSTGGKDGRSYIITNRITTDGGRVFDQTFSIVVKTG